MIKKNELSLSDIVKPIDSEYNRRLDIVGKESEIRYFNDTVGLLIFVKETKQWAYYFINKLEVEKI